MFTFGMFTSHIPYIALVAFYAYFVLFGMEKASKGELVVENKNPFIYEIQVTDNFDGFNSGCFYYQTSALHAEYSKFEDFIFKRKLSQPALNDNLHYRFFYIPNTSNRPPPILS
jgi:hypothetical protein